VCEAIISENPAELAIACRDIDSAYAAIERALQSLMSEMIACVMRPLSSRAACQRASGDLAGAITTLQHALALSGHTQDAILAAELPQRLSGDVSGRYS
jgi:hypothetical protein